jgi:uncharacterized protein (DUF433 family)
LREVVLNHLSALYHDLDSLKFADGYNRAMISAIEIGSLIDRDPAVRAGRPKIAGTGVTVMRVAAWYKMGLTPEEIATQYGHLSLAQVHAALAYYHANPEEIETDISEERTFAEKVDREPESQSPR